MAFLKFSNVGPLMPFLKHWGSQTEWIFLILEACILRMLIFRRPLDSALLGGLWFTKWILVNCRLKVNGAIWHIY